MDPKPRTDDYIKNLIRKMLREEGWVQREEVTQEPGCLPGVPFRGVKPDFPDGLMVPRS